jgi:NitT/TauT family transport system ATP-binding protein
MRQRVGFARALVVEPDLLLMDEPFSALDILTTEGLRGDLINLWCQKKTKINAILCVTHDIEEAVLMSDRIIIFASDPGTVQTDIKIDLAHPRDTESAEFKKVVDKIYHKMTVSERYRIMKAKAMAIMSSTDEEHP